MFDSPRAVRLACREGRFAAPTAGLAPGFVQANLVVLPAAYADDFEAYCRANAKPCPLLERLPAGSFTPRVFAPDADLRTDLPLYRYCTGDTSHAVTDVSQYWTADAVAFLLGCSFGFEESITAAGLPLRHVDQGVNVPMYRTNRATHAVGMFEGPLVVSMRPMPRARVQDAYDATRRFVAAHGEPMFHGAAAASWGVVNLGHPDWGDFVRMTADDVPVFWACGVTSQVALQAALQNGTLPWAITHAPGHMLVCDVESRSLLG